MLNTNVSLELNTLQHNSELRCTGTILAHIFDSFFSTYCPSSPGNLFKDNNLQWLRGVNIKFGCDALDPSWDVKPDGCVVITILEQQFVVAVVEDKANVSQENEDRCPLAEISRHMHDSIRKHFTFLESKELQDIIIPTVHTAGSKVAFYLTKWIYESEHFYLFTQVAKYDLRKLSQLTCAIQRLWNILEIISKNVEVINRAATRRWRKDHEYTWRNHIDRPPKSASESQSSSSKSASSKSASSKSVSDKNTIQPKKRDELPREATLQQDIESLGYCIAECIQRRANSFVFVAYNLTDTCVFKIDPKDKEIEILQALDGKNHVVTLQDVVQLPSGTTALKLPYHQVHCLSCTLQMI